jgi:hypothetical protein
MYLTKEIKEEIFNTEKNKHWKQLYSEPFEKNRDYKTERC